jgi:hypothetical protein
MDTLVKMVSRKIIFFYKILQLFFGSNISTAGFAFLKLKVRVPNSSNTVFFGHGDYIHGTNIMTGTTSDTVRRSLTERGRHAFGNPATLKPKRRHTDYLPANPDTLTT